MQKSDRIDYVNEKGKKVDLFSLNKGALVNWLKAYHEEYIKLENKNTTKEPSGCLGCIHSFSSATLEPCCSCVKYSEYSKL